MLDAGFPYPERVLQWVWEHMQFNIQQLHTECGQPISILDQGQINRGAGPDFLHARIRIGEMTHYGHVEIHIHEPAWVHHGHDTDSRYDAVVLHVVFDRAANERKARRTDGTTIPTLCLKPHLEQPVSALLQHPSGAALPCGSHLRFIHQDAFERQIEIAHRDYLDYKADEILAGYDPSLPLSNAWKKATARALFGLLGGAQNKETMVQLFDELHAQHMPDGPVQAYIAAANRLAFEPGNRELGVWQHTGCRPAARPERRVPQAATLAHRLFAQPLTAFLNGPDAARSLLFVPGSTPLPGNPTQQLITGTVLLPALYLLANLLHDNTCKEQVLTAWNCGAQFVPNSIQKPFKRAGFALPPHLMKPGLAHQYKRYCQPGRCDRCEVFKSAISS
ncbi:MAG: DUF2851 family protein [Balneolaceae bacterium]